MPRILFSRALSGVAASALLGLASPAAAAPVLLISIDGMNPQYVTEADARGFKVPNLKRFLTEGSFARGVRGVTPTITCPSHATLVTGVTPSKHGITGNDPMRSDGHVSSLCTFAADIKVDTLWDAAARAGIDSGSVGWPNTAGATSVRYNVPHVEPYDSDATVRFQEAMARPEGLLTTLEAKLGSYRQTPDERGSAIRTRFAIELMRQNKPGLMLFHVVALDAASHKAGPYGAPAKQAVEAEDTLVGELIAAAQAIDPSTIVAVVSDHGHAPVSRRLNLRVALVEAGLIRIDTPEAGKAMRVIDRRVDVWGDAIKLTDPADAEARSAVRALLTRLAADPANGIARVLEGADVEALGGWPGSDFALDMREGTTLGGLYTGPLVIEGQTVIGHHGYLPHHATMNAAFMIKGPGVKAGQDLGVVDMVQVAPTLAKALGVTLNDAKATPLPVFTR